MARRGSSWLGPLGPRRVLRWLPALPVLAVAVRLMAGPNLDFVRGPRLALLRSGRDPSGALYTEARVVPGGVELVEEQEESEAFWHPADTGAKRVCAGVES